MVSFDLDVKAVIGLAENGSISEKDLKVHLEKFEKEDLITFIVGDVFNTENSEEDDKEEELDAEDY